MMNQMQYVMYTLQNAPVASEAARKSVHASSERAADLAAQLSAALGNANERQVIGQLAGHLKE
jgi:hypothetical protein